MQRAVFSLILVSMFSIVSAQNEYYISKPEPSFRNNVLSVKYNITGCGRNEFVDITLILINSKGDTLKPHYITGDIGRMISCGSGKTIEWNLEKDNVKMSDDVEVIIKGVKSAIPVPDINSSGLKKITRGNIILSSLFIPGLGQKKASGRSVYLVFSGVVYGSIASSIFLTLKASGYKDKYNNSSGSVRDDMFSKWQKTYDQSKVFIYGAACSWAANIIWSAVIPVKASADKNLNISLKTPGNKEMLLSAKWTF